MAISLGMRISGLLVAGAVAVAVTAFDGDGRGTPDGGGGSTTIVTVGPSGAARPSAAPRPAAPRESPAGEASGTVPAGGSGPPHVPTAPPPPSASPSPSSSGSLLTGPVWLPPGPAAPEAAGVADPSSVYDRLHDPRRCRAAAAVIPGSSADPEWRVLRALADACLALQGQGDRWSTVAEDHADLAGKLGTCKGRAAYAVLGGLLDFHRRHPGATAEPVPAPDGAPACAYRIAGVGTGGDGVARPGDTVTIELRDTYFDQTGLLRSASVFIGGRRLAGPPVPKSRSGDRLVLSAVVPPLDRYPRPVDVVVRYGGTEARLKDAFTVAAPTALPSPGLPSGTPQGVLTLGPLPVDPSRP
ncbi:hypothetical protein [Streptomyces sediminimaris]|uniref:hypothetical protein n=1 Tax=Streptomyces sediminimaris TaxID=3383721 RepID=UPI00399A0621